MSVSALFVVALAAVAAPTSSDATSGEATSSEATSREATPSEATSSGAAPPPSDDGGADAHPSSLDDDGPAAAERRAFSVDGALFLLAEPASSGLGALQTPFVGARFGYGQRGRARGPLALDWNVDGGLFAGGFASGTSAVRADRGALLATARATLGARIGGSRFAIVPFALAQGAILVGGTLLRVNDTLAPRAIVAPGAHLGVGLELSLGALALSLETGAGMLGLSPSTMGALALSWRF